jgi:hypothetical protein
MSRKWTLIPDTPYFILCDVALLILAGLIVGIGPPFLLIMTPGRPDPVDRCGKLQPTSRRLLRLQIVRQLHHVDTRERCGVNPHLGLLNEKPALFDGHLNLPAEDVAVFGVVGERVMPLAIWFSSEFLRNGELVAISVLQQLLL